MWSLGLASAAWPCLVSTDSTALLCWASWPLQLVAHNITPFLQSRKLGLMSSRDLPENVS